KMPENIIKEFNAENDIKVADRDDSALPSPQTPAIDLTAHTVRYCFDNIITNAGYYVKQTLGLSTRTGTGVSDSLGGEGVEGSVRAEPEHPIESSIAPAPPAVIPIHTDTHIPEPLAPGSHRSAPINYLDVELNPYDFATTDSSPNMPYITFTACVGTICVTCVRFAAGDYRAVKRLIEISRDSTGARNPDTMVALMDKSGFSGWQYKKCVNYFYNALYFYEKCLANCPNRETAVTVYPLFTAMHAFVPYYLMTAKDFAKLNELKRMFDKKCGQCVTTITTPTVAPLPTCTAATDADTIAPVDPTPTGCSEHNPIDYLCLPVTGRNFVTNTSSPHLPYKTSIVKVKGVWFRTGHFGAANHLALNRLLRLVDKHRSTDGRPMTETEWERVAIAMLRVGDHNKPDVVFDPKLCQNYVQNALDLYKKTLEVCPNMDRAGIAFPMFYTLHEFNPESVVSDAECREIKRLRKLFANMCRICGTYIEDQRPESCNTAPVNTFTSNIPNTALVCSKLSGDPTIVAPFALPAAKASAPPIQTNVSDIAPVGHKLVATLVSTASALPVPSVTGPPYRPPMDSQLRPITVSTKVIVTSPVYPPNLTLAGRNDVHELYVMCAKITHSDLLVFTHLCRCVDEAIQMVSPFEENQELFWSHVSQLMLDSGHTLTPNKSCQFLFTVHVTKFYKICGHFGFTINTGPVTGSAK
ncbi:unnamed protein product, partial [Medioppia subpectinata]